MYLGCLWLALGQPGGYSLINRNCSFLHSYGSASETRRGRTMRILDLIRSEEAQDIAEYAVMLAVILVIVVGTIRLVGSNANTVFSQAASSIQ